MRHLHCPAQVNDVVRGAALSFRDLQEIGLRRCSGLTDDALSALLRGQRRPHQVITKVGKLRQSTCCNIS